MTELNQLVADSSTVGKSFSSGGKSYTIGKADNFCYTDPVDGSVTKNQVTAGEREGERGSGTVEEKGYRNTECRCKDGGIFPLNGRVDGYAIFIGRLGHSETDNKEIDFLARRCHIFFCRAN